MTFYHAEWVKVKVGKYKGESAIVLKFYITHNPLLYEVALDNGTVLALYENEIESLN